MPFEFNDLNVQLLPDNIYPQLCPLLTHTCPCLSQPLTPCLCISHPATFQTCYCLSRAITCRCLTKPITRINECRFQSIPFTCGITKECTISAYDQLTPVIREVVNPIELEVLREELAKAMSHVEIQRKVMIETQGPQSEAAFDEAEKQLSEQLEALKKQRDSFRQGGGGGSEAPRQKK